MKKNPMSEILAHNGTPTVRMTLAAVLTLAMPAIIEQVMVTMVQYIDTAMVGSLGSVSTAAVGLTASSTWLIGGFLNAAAVGFSIQVAQYVGAGNSEMARQVTGQALKFVAIFGIIVGAIAVCVASPLPYWLGAGNDIAEPASLYFRIFSCAVPFNFCVLMLSAIIRCSGDTKTPMLLNLLINVFNVIFNFLLIYPTRTVRFFSFEFTMFGADMGVAGAALGSLLALLIISMLFIIVIFKKESPVRISLREKYKFDRTCLLTALRVGIPVALERTLMSFAQIVITSIISRIGTVAIAANHLAVQAESLSYMPAYGVATAGTTLIGQAIGAKRKDLAIRFSRIVTYIGILIMLFGGAMLFFFAPQLIGLFSSDPEVLELGASVLRIVAFAEPFFAMSIVVTGVLRGSGDTTAPFIISLITMWGIRITLSLVLVNSLGLVGVWVAMAVELCVRGILFMFRMFRGKWLEKEILTGNE